MSGAMAMTRGMKMPFSEVSQSIDPPRPWTGRLVFLSLAAGLVAAGLVLRLIHWGLPLWAHHFGGGFLWGAMVYALVAALRPAGWRTLACLLLAMTVIVAVESFRLVHGPGLDAFRATLAGQLLLGRVFSAWNMGVDALGAAAIAGLTARLT